MYERKCKECNHSFIVLNKDVSEPCPRCSSSITRRVFSFNPITSFQPHYSTALGRYVTTRQDFLDGLAKASEANTIRTGVEHNYVPVEWQDSSAFGATDDGMDSYYSTPHELMDIS